MLMQPRVPKSLLLIIQPYDTLLKELEVTSDNLWGVVTIDPAALTIQICSSRGFAPFPSLESNET